MRSAKRWPEHSVIRFVELNHAQILAFLLLGVVTAVSTASMAQIVLMVIASLRWKS